MKDLCLSKCLIILNHFLQKKLQSDFRQHLSARTVDRQQKFDALLRDVSESFDCV